MAYTGHGHHIPGTAASPTPPRQKARCGGPGMCAECSTDASRSLKRITTVMLTAWTALEGSDGIFDVTMDRESVLFKVKDSLIASGLTEDQMLNAILSMQNNGILFRERLP